MLEYQMQCKCGNQVSIEVDAQCSLLRVRCRICQHLLVNYQDANKNTHAPIPKTQTNVDLRKNTQLLPQIGEQKLGEYLLIKSLGNTSMGDIYLAVNEKTQEKAAIKILSKTTDKEILNYFLREIKLLMKLNHPNIIGVKDYGSYGDAPYVAMEYIKGSTLSDIIRQEPLGCLDGAKVIYYVLKALEHAWSHQIIHRDLKPRNIFIDQSGEVKVINLGLGKIIDETYNITKTGQIIGTPCYVAPEQIVNIKSASHRSDVYSIGAILFHALCGKAPFAEFKENIQELFFAKTQNTYRKLVQNKPDLPKELIAIVEKAMAHDPNDRYQSAKDMRTDVSAFYKAFGKARQ